MFNVGIDFDNTLVNYDKSFYDLAIEKKLVPVSLPKSKNAVRNFLKENGKEKEFTIMQGEIYGPRILQAQPSQGSIKAIQAMHKLGFNVFIVSHKTRFPYEGPKFDLHDSARKWLNHFSFSSSIGANINQKNIFFNESKEEKIEKLHNLKCDFFIDDLPEILDLINNTVRKILYSRNYEKFKSKYDFVSNDWQLIEKYLYGFL